MIRRPVLTTLPVWPLTMAPNTAGKIDWLGLWPNTQAFQLNSCSHHSTTYKNENTALETPHKGIVGCESQYRNRVFISSQACPWDHEVLLRHGTGNKRLLCLTKYTSTGNNTNTHISTSKMFFRTFEGFTTYSIGAIELITLSIANIFYLWCVVAEGCQDNDKIFLWLRKVTHSV